ncbi:MAG: Spy/CpxP family protein refolding chaperone [Labilithrix sp.]|nr:Spy/CpxP family protein refolding chaperone [Labilithrix sp.]
MKLFTRTRFIVPVGLVVATAAVPALAAAPEEAAKKEAAPTHCPGMEEAKATLAGEATRGGATKDDATKHEAEPQREPTGPLALVGAALQKVCLSNEQRAAVEKLGDQVRPKEEAVMDARQALRQALLEQLEAGKIDERALDDEIDALVKAREEASPVLRKALEELHGILDPGQRAAFVDAIESRTKEIAEDSRGWLDTLAKDLALSDEQKQRVGAVLDKAKPALDEERSRASKAFDAFKKDEFSIDEVVPVGDVGERTRKRAEGMVGVAKELASILTPEQRRELAGKLEGRSHAGGHGAGGSATTSAQPDEVGVTTQPLVVARGGGFRAGGVRGWSSGGYVRGGYVRGGYAARGVAVGTGYAAGYPLVGAGPGIW